MDFNIDDEFEIYQTLGKEKLFLKLRKEKTDIDKKIHIFKVFDTLTGIQKIFNEGEFLSAGVHFLKIKNYKDCDSGNLIRLEIADTHNKEIYKYDSHNNYIPFYKKLVKLFASISLNDFFCDDFREKNVRIFAIDELLTENLKSLFFNIELKALLNHALLEKNLAEKSSKEVKNKI